MSSPRYCPKDQHRHLYGRDNLNPIYHSWFMLSLAGQYWSPQNAGNSLIIALFSHL